MFRFEWVASMPDYPEQKVHESFLVTIANFMLRVMKARDPSFRSRISDQVLCVWFDDKKVLEKKPQCSGLAL
jgi:hypothetical protein